MKKIRSKSKKGFTLVELIVVLVILAILAAMLVPALTGYIDRAKKEKNYQAASTVLTAVQSLVTEQYVSGTTSYTINNADVVSLAGINCTLTSTTITTDANGIVQGFTVEFAGDSDYGYKYNGPTANPMWEAVAHS